MSSPRPSAGGPELILRPRTLLSVLAIAIAALTLLGLLAVRLDAERPLGAGAGWVGFARLIDLNEESNLPTWFSTGQLLLAAGTLALLAGRARARSRPYVRHWLGLALIFLFLSLDEAGRVHEFVGETIHAYFPTTGVLRFSWVIPYGLLTLFLTVCYVPFLRDLPRRTRSIFLLSAAIFLGGALGFEFLEGWWTTHRWQGQVLDLFSVAEECCEMSGVALFLYGMLDYLARDGGEVRLAFGQPSSTSQMGVEPEHVLTPRSKLEREPDEARAVSRAKGPRSD